MSDARPIERVVLDEQFEFFRDSSSFSKPLKDIYTSLEQHNVSLQGQFPVVLHFLNDFIFEKHIGIEFFHEGKTYTYRNMVQDTVRQQDSEDPFPSPSRIPAEYVFHIDDCEEFFTALITFQDAVDQQKGALDWFEHMSVVTVWERATLHDLEHPVEFLHQLTQEMRNGGMPYLSWTNIGALQTREPMTLVVHDTISPSSYVEGPHTLHMAIKTLDKQIPDDTDHIQSVVYGLDTSTKATIYSVQLDPIEDQSVGRIKLREANIKEGISMLNAMLAEDLPNLRISFPEEYETSDIPDLLQQMVTLQEYIQNHEVRDKQHYLHRIERTMKFLTKEADTTHIIDLLDERQNRLKRCNPMTGGASMVSFMTALALLRRQGITTVRIPTYLPFIQHVGDHSTEEIHETLSEALLQRIRTLQSITNIPPPVEEGISYIYLDLGDWQIDMTKVNKENRFIAPLLEHIKTSL